VARKSAFTVGAKPLTFNETMKRSKKRPYIGVTQGGSSKRPTAGAKPAATRGKAQAAAQASAITKERVRGSRE
jgi:hypothetical protein